MPPTRKVITAEFHIWSANPVLKKDDQLVPKNMGNISAILLPADRLTSEEKRDAKLVDQKELRVLLELAKKEYDRLESNPREFYLVLANPPSISFSEVEVDRLMQNLGSTKEIGGSWLPIVVKTGDHFFRVWGKTAYCG